MNDASQKSKNIAVIGAGIIGVQLARALQVGGHQVVLIDPLEPGMGTSFGNAGYLAIDEIFPLAHGTVLRRLPSMLLKPNGPLAMRWHEFPRLLPWYLAYARACSTARVEKSIQALAAIQRAALPAWLRVRDRDGLHSLIVGNGAATVFETDAGFRRTRAQRERQREFGIDWQTYSGAEVRELIGDISPLVRHAVCYTAGHHVVNSLSVTQAIFGAFIDDGGRYEKSAVERLKRSAADTIDLVIAGSTRTFDQIALCTGYKTKGLLEPLNFRVPLVAERGYHVEMSHRETQLAMPVGSYERGFYVTPMTSGLRLAGTTEFSSAVHEAPPTWARADILKRHIAELMPGLALEETGRWMGHRPSLSDFLPVIGRAPGLTNLYLSFGHHHLGLTQSAISAELLSPLMSGGPTSIELAPYDLARFQ